MDKENLQNKALQDIIAPDGVCFGCGPCNKNGLQIKSYWDTNGEYVIMRYTPAECYVGWPSLLYGGLISCLIDCHSNCTARANHYRVENREPGSLPCIECVTGSLGVKYIKPTPLGAPLFLRAFVEGAIGRKTRIICEVYVDETLVVLGDSIFVRVDVEHLTQKIS